MENSKHPEHKERKEWLGKFESEKFDAAEVSFEDPKKRLKERQSIASIMKQHGVKELREN